jgi:hypothetical protein
MRALVSSGMQFSSARQRRLRCEGINCREPVLAAFSIERGRSTLCSRAPGASTYIRQLHDGLPQSCMHSADDRGDGVTLFAGARDANRILELPVAPLPDPAGPEALKKPPRDYAAAAMCGVVLAMTAPSGTKPVST